MSLVLGFVSASLYWLFSLICLLPSISLGIRRLHDTDRSGWWLLIAFIPLVGLIVLLYFACLRGTTGPNRFGADPLGGVPSAPVV